MSDRTEAIKGIQQTANDLFSEGRDFVTGIIDGQAFLCTVHVDGPQRITLASGITVEVRKRRESNEKKR